MLDLKVSRLHCSDGFDDCITKYCLQTRDCWLGKVWPVLGQNTDRLKRKKLSQRGHVSGLVLFFVVVFLFGCFFSSGLTRVSSTLN